MQKRVVFVVGAGASNEAGLPTGAELKDIIASMLDFNFDYQGYNRSGDREVAHALNKMASATQSHNAMWEAMTEAARRIKMGLIHALSIDAFIHSNRNDELITLCGKYAIVKAILDAERSSRLASNKLMNDGTTLDLSPLAKTWYHSFATLLFNGYTKEELPARLESVTLIIFNYDRCIEQYLYHMLMIFYGISEIESAELVKHINIIHPFGTVGSLPWYSDAVHVAFGAEYFDIATLAKGIKTYTEFNAPESEVVAAIREAMRTAESLVFLGFAFHPLNMDLLSPRNGVHQTLGRPWAFASAYGLSDPRIERAKAAITDLYGQSVFTEIKSLKCYDFFAEYWDLLVF